jgi:hypothetical protein
MSWVLSSAGRASPLQGEGRGFDPLSTHHILVRNTGMIVAMAKDFRLYQVLEVLVFCACVLK